MTAGNDDGFIRQLLDSPRDNAPRLAYADWLEDSGDTRAGYWRVSRHAFGSTYTTPLLPGFALVVDPRA